MTLYKKNVNVTKCSEYSSISLLRHAVHKSKSEREKGVLGNLLMSPIAEGKRCSESWDFGLDGPQPEEHLKNFMSRVRGIFYNLSCLIRMFISPLV